MILPIEALIKEASMELGSDACRVGKHQWESEGGRACPYDLKDNCSQPVYRCSCCGTYDYGETGGPGETDCSRYCSRKEERAIARLSNKIDPLWLGWYSSGSGFVLHRLKLKLLKKQPKPRLP